MKSLLLASILALSFSAFADHHEGHGKNFEEAKKMALEGIDKRISALNQHKSCVQAASDRDGLKKCHQEMKAKRKAMKGEMKGKMQEFRAKKKEERAAKKK